MDSLRNKTQAVLVVTIHKPVNKDLWISRDGGTT